MNDGVGLAITTSGAEAHGAQADTGGLITLVGGSVTTSGSGALGLYSTGANSQIAATNVSVATSGGNFANGVLAENGGTVTLNGGAVQTSGADVVAVVATPGGTLKLTGTSITATGLGAGGIEIGGSTAAFTGSNLKIVTHGNYDSANGFAAAGSPTRATATTPTAAPFSSRIRAYDDRLAGHRRR